MISHEETMRLIALAQQGDEQACTTLIVENTPLVKSIVKRYLGKSVEYDDLLQIAHIGLLKAIKNFSAQYDVKFSTYAVPMILGELKRYMRDEGYIKVSRTVKSLAAKIMKYTEELCQKGETADVEKIARHFDTDVNEVVFALDAMRRPVSLYETTSDKEGKETALVDKLPSDEDKQMISKLILKDMLSKLTERERKLVVLRYFRDMTQWEIARKMGVSQVQISRMESKVIKKLREMYDGD